ncbi:hypothetical protein BH23CHL4_BH23CHL4_22850 [soil metagenome]
MEQGVTIGEARRTVEVGPSSAYEAVTRSMVDGLADDVKEIRNRINGMFWLIAGTVTIDLVLRIAGLGA